VKTVVLPEQKEWKGKCAPDIIVYLISPEAQRIILTSSLDSKYFAATSLPLYFRLRKNIFIGVESLIVFRPGPFTGNSER
jgi:hypothetical protein